MPGCLSSPSADVDQSYALVKSRSFPRLRRSRPREVGYRETPAFVETLWSWVPGKLWFCGDPLVWAEGVGKF